MSFKPYMIEANPSEEPQIIKDFAEKDCADIIIHGYYRTLKKFHQWKKDSVLMMATIDRHSEDVKKVLDERKFVQEPLQEWHLTSGYFEDVTP